MVLINLHQKGCLYVEVYTLCSVLLLPDNQTNLAIFSELPQEAGDGRKFIPHQKQQTVGPAEGPPASLTPPTTQIASHSALGQPTRWLQALGS